MPPYNAEAPQEEPSPRESSHSTPDTSTGESVFSDSSVISDSETSSTDSDYIVNAYVLSAPGYEKISIPLEQNLKQLLVSTYSFMFSQIL